MSEKEKMTEKGKKHSHHTDGKYKENNPKTADGVRTDQDYFLEVKDLFVEYTSGKDIVKAVNGVTFSVRRGETLGLVGETGAGKTTIAKAIMRILPDPPAKIKSGQIFIEGEDLLEKSERAMLHIRGNKVAMIFQDPMTALNPVMTIGEQISEVILNHNRQYTRLDAKEHAIEMLKTVGIPPERYGEYPHQFSGGMKQRVVIAMALACNPDVLLADEPTTALDVTIQAQVLDLINDLKQNYNTSMVLITHDLGVIAETCDKVAVIYAGQIVESGSKRSIFKNPTHPYTQGLFNALPKLDDDSKRLKPINGLPPDPTNLPSGCAFAPRCPYVTDQCTQKDVPLYEIEARHSRHLVRCVREKDHQVGPDYQPPKED